MDITVMVAMGVGLILMIILMVFMISLYQRCAPNQVMLVTGYGPMKIVRGGGAIVVPLIQQKHLISLTPIEIELKPSGSMTTKDSATVNLPAKAVMRIGNSDEAITKAAETLLSKSDAQTAAIAKDILFIQLRTLVSTLSLQELKVNIDLVSARALEQAGESLARYGLTADSLSVSEVQEVKLL